MTSIAVRFKPRWWIELLDEESKSLESFPSNACRSDGALLHDVYYNQLWKKLEDLIKADEKKLTEEKIAQMIKNAHVRRNEIFLSCGPVVII